MIQKFSLVLSLCFTLNAANAYSSELVSVSPSTRTLLTTSPTISNLNGDQVAWGGRSTPVLIDADGNATVSDPENESLNGGNGDWAGATLTIQRSGVAVSSDQFSFGQRDFFVLGNTLTVGGLSFATFSNSNGVLSISLTSQATTATTALVNGILQQIYYTNNTPAGDATLRITLNDGSGAAAATADVLVTTDLIYVTNSTDTGTIDPSNGVSFSEAVAIAALDTSGSQIIGFSSTLSGLTLTINSVSISENLTLDSDLNSTITLSGGTITGASGTVLEFSNGTGDVLTLNAILAGAGSLKKVGSGILNLRGTNTFTGSTTIDLGKISFGLDAHLGTPPSTPTPGHLVLQNGGILQFTNITTPFIALNSNRGILLNGIGGGFEVMSGTEPGVSSIIAGSGALVKSGPSQIRVDGANTYSGGTVVNNGTLFGGAGSQTKTSFGSGTITINPLGTLWGDRNNLSNPIILNGGKLLGTNGFGEIWNGPITLQTDSYIQAGYAMIINGQISGPGKLILSGSHPINSRLILTNSAIHTGGTELIRGVLQMGNNGLTGEVVSNITTTVNSQVRFSRTNTFTYPGVISGPGGVNKISGGTVILTGIHSYTGTTLVEEGTLLINGSISSSTNVTPVTNKIGTLGGIGTINGNVTLQTRGVLAPGGPIGRLTINGNLAMVTGSTFAVDINGSTVGTENDQVAVNGTVDVSAATLTVTHNNTSGGTLYTVLDNDQSEAITGTFNGIAEGALFTAGGNGAILSASYTTNGVGNDILLVNRFSPVFGRNQTAPVKEAVAFPPTVQVSNADGSLASGVNVTFATTTGKVNAPLLANSASWYSTGGSEVTNLDWKAHLFTTGSSAVQIDQISLVLNSFDPTSFPYPTTVSAQVAIYSVVNGTPFQEIESLTVQNLPIPSAGSWVNFDFSTPMQLDAQTQYALVVKSTSPTGFKWANVRSLSTNPTGVASLNSSLATGNSGSSWTAAVQNNAFAIRSVAASTGTVTLTTNANGIAALGRWALGDRQGNQTLTATSANLASNPLTFTAIATPILPLAPTNLVVTPGTGSVSIAFSAGYDGGANLSNYQYSLNNGSTWTSLSPARTSSPVTIPGLTNGVTYPIMLRGVNSVGPGASSAVVNATPIKPITDVSVTVDPVSNQTFTGSALTPTLVVKDGGTLLVLGTHYSVVYTSNINVGTATATITGRGTYSGTRTRTFTIVPAQISAQTIAPFSPLTFSGAALTPNPSVKNGNLTLTLGTDYTVAYSSNTNVGTATVTITGRGNYSGTKAQNFNIVAKSVSSLTIDSIASQTYTGSAIMPAAVVKDGITTLSLGTDYSVVYSENTSVGTATVTVTGVGNYSGTKTLTFEILSKPATALSVDPIANQTYSGSPINPGLVVKDGTTTLVRGVDFTVSFTGSTNVGTGTVTITGIGNYSGTIQQSFTIAAKPASSLTIDAIANQVYSGSRLTPDVVVKDGNAILELGTDYSIAYSDNINAGIATVTITGLGNYAASKTQTFTIAKKALTLRADSKSKIYGDSNPGLSFSYSGLVTGDTEIDELPRISTQATMTSGVGKYRIILSGGADPNYSISLVEGVLEVTPASLSLTVIPVTKIFGQADPIFTYLLQGLKGTDSEAVLRGALTRELGEDPGSYRINQGTLNAGANYTLTVTGSTLAITKAKALSVADIASLSTEWAKEAPLPATVNVLASHGQYYKVEVKWDKSNLNLLARGSYSLIGTLILPVGIENPDQVLAEIQVQVLPKPAPLDLTLTNSSFEGSTTNYFIAVGDFVVNDPVDNIHTVSLLGPGYDNPYFEIKDNILFWSSADRAPGKTTFSIVVRVTDRDGNTLDKFFEIRRSRLEFADLTIPSAFTPNGDGINESWKISDLRFYSNVRIQVFNQGGEIVFNTENPDQGWDGTFNGKNLPIGTYFWAIEVGETGEYRKGFITLLRN